MDINRAENKVNYSIWIRNKLCRSKKYFLNSNPKLINIFCQLNDSQIEKASLYISANLNFTRAKEIVIFLFKIIKKIILFYNRFIHQLISTILCLI